MPLTTPFRDDALVAIAKAAALERENAELRSRLEDVEDALRRARWQRPPAHRALTLGLAVLGGCGVVAAFALAVLDGDRAFGTPVPAAPSPVEVPTIRGGCILYTTLGPILSLVASSDRCPSLAEAQRQAVLNLLLYRPSNGPIEGGETHLQADGLSGAPCWMKIDEVDPARAGRGDVWIHSSSEPGGAGSVDYDVLLVEGQRVRGHVPLVRSGG